MKNINLKIFIISIFLIFLSVFPQDSLTVKNKCDSLKAVYEAKVDEWREIENEMKKLIYRTADIDSYVIARIKYDSLMVLYNHKWKPVKELKFDYLRCINRNLDSYQHYNNPPPPPPPPYYSDDEHIHIWTTDVLKPYLPKDMRKIMYHYIKENYPANALTNLTSGTVILKILCGVDGRADSILILYENPKNENFGKTAVEAIKNLKFRPKTKRGVPVEEYLNLFINFKPPKKDPK